MGAETAGRASGAAPGGPIDGLVDGFRLHCAGFQMLVRERSLWALSAVPVAFSILALAAAGVAIAHYAGDIGRWIDGLWPVFDAESWLAWLWVGPLRAIFWLLGWLIFLVVAAAAAVLALLGASVAAAPFLDALARRAEMLASGRVVEGEDTGAGALLRDVARSIAGEARRVLFFLAIWSVLFAAGVVVPGAHLITGPLMVAITILFLPLEFSGYTLDRRRVSFAARRRWVVAHRARMAGFGAAAFATCFVPGVNLLLIPGLVVGGTLLVLRDPPAETGPGVAPRCVDRPRAR